jgi:DNA-directed RNA polymerase delta subunit
LNQATTGSIAAKLNAKTGSEVALAAAAYLSLVQRKPTFTRQELLDAMKTASGRYKQSFSDNLSSYITTLAKDGKLLSPGNDTYSLSAGTASDLQKQLAAN